MISEERTKFIKFLAKNGIDANSLSDAEIWQRAQKVQSEQSLKKSGIPIGKEENPSKKKQERKKSRIATKKIPDK